MKLGSRMNKNTNQQKREILSDHCIRTACLMETLWQPWAVMRRTLGVVRRHWSRLISDTQLQVWPDKMDLTSGAIIVWVLHDLKNVFPGYLASPVCTPHHSMVWWFIVRFKSWSGGEKRQIMHNTFFLQPIYCKIMAWIVSYCHSSLHLLSFWAKYYH